MWPFDVLGGIFEEVLNFWEIKLFEAQGELRNESLILVYASTLPTDTLLIINFLVFLWASFVENLVMLVQDNCSEKGELAVNLIFWWMNSKAVGPENFDLAFTYELKQESSFDNRRFFYCRGKRVMVDYGGGTARVCRRRARRSLSVLGFTSLSGQHPRIRNTRSNQKKLA